MRIAEGVGSEWLGCCKRFLRALALFGRRPPQRVEGFVMPASKNLHNVRRTHYEYMSSALPSIADTAPIARCWFNAKNDGCKYGKLYQQTRPLLASS